MHSFIDLRSLITVSCALWVRWWQREDQTGDLYLCSPRRQNVTVISPCKQFCPSVHLSVNMAAAAGPSMSLHVIYSLFVVASNHRPRPLAKTAGRDRGKSSRVGQHAHGRTTGPARSTLFSYWPPISRENRIKFWTRGFCHSIDILQQQYACSVTPRKLAC